MYQLYYSPRACSLSVHAVLEEIGVPFEAIRVDFSKNEQSSTSYRAINPKGKVPVLVHDNFVLSEVPAILNYLMEMHPECSLQVQNDTQEKYRINEWLQYLNGTVHPAFTRVFRSERFCMVEQHVDDIRATALKDIKSFFDFLNQQLSKTAYISGSEVRLPDFYLYVLLNWWMAIEGSLSTYPQLEIHFEHMQKRPSVQRAIETERVKVN